LDALSEHIVIDGSEVVGTKCPSSYFGVVDVWKRSIRHEWRIVVTGIELRDQVLAHDQQILNHTLE
jgi:hypothetical protein